MKNVESILYVGFNQLTCPNILKLTGGNTKLTEMVPFAVSHNATNILHRILPHKISNEFTTRYYRPKYEGSKRIFYDIPFLIARILRLDRIHLIQKIAKYIFRLQLKRQIKQHDLVIIPSDFLRDYSGDFNKLILEIRWHNLWINSYRPAKLLNIPFQPDDKSWHEYFEEIHTQLCGIIVYSDLAYESYEASHLNLKSIFKVPLSIPNFDYARPQNLRRDRELLYVGRGAFDKALDIAVTIARKLKYRLTVVGTYSPEVKEWILEQDDIDFLGRLSHQDLFSVMQSHKVYLATGIESFGYSVIEALKCGMFVVGSRFIGALNWCHESSKIFYSDSIDVEILTLYARQALDEYHEDYDFEFNVDTEPFWRRIIEEIQG